MTKYKTAIAFFPKQEKQFIKYRNVTNTKTLENYLQKNNAQHVNYYDAKTKMYLYQIRFESEKNK